MKSIVKFEKHSNPQKHIISEIFEKHIDFFSENLKSIVTYYALGHYGLTPVFFFILKEGARRFCIIIPVFFTFS